MNPQTICQHCGYLNPDDISFCSGCAKFLRPSDHLRGLTLALALLTALSGLAWGAALYVGMGR